MPHQHALSDAPPNRSAGLDVPAAEVIAGEQRVVEAAAGSDAVVLGTCELVFGAAPGNCLGGPEG